MFKIQRSADENSVILTLSGRIKAERLAELEKLLKCEASDHSLVLDLKEVKLVDRDVVSFLANWESKGVNIANCPAYIREWIEKETVRSEDS
jgi:anti-anti-sigma regulatory factor